MRKIKFLIIGVTYILFIGSCSILKSQSIFGNDSEIEKKGSKFSGGNLSLMFGTTTYFDISPHFGYYLTNRLSVAGGFTYAYYSEKGTNYHFEESIYGGRTFVRFDLFKQIFVHAELEALNIENNPSIIGISTTGERRWLVSPLAGVGYRQSFSDLSGVNLLLLWNFDETLDYPYGNPILRIGIEFGW